MGLSMPAGSVRAALAEVLLSSAPAAESVRSRVSRIHQDLLARSPYIRIANFTAIHPGDLAFLFDAYDREFLGGLCRPALEGIPVGFRLSARMTRAGGKTILYRLPSGGSKYEIAIAGSMLFDGFRENDRRITVCGLECRDRLEALQRIFEHEMVHLGELLCWEKSDCTAARFQGIAARLFLHRAHTHDLITRKERAAASGIRVGARVAFHFDGRRLTGRVNRITRRATVLVEDPDGVKHSDGLRYKIYYVPIAGLAVILEPPADPEAPGPAA